MTKWQVARKCKFPPYAILYPFRDQKWRPKHKHN